MEGQRGVEEAGKGVGRQGRVEGGREGWMEAGRACMTRQQFAYIQTGPVAFKVYTVITARTVYQFYLEVALFHSELSFFFSIKCFPDLERNISRS